MRCHVAFARATGRWNDEGCPLYLRGLEVRLSSDGAAVDVTSEDSGTAEAIRQRFRSRLVL